MGGEDFCAVGGINVEVIGMAINVMPLSGEGLMDRAFG